MARRLYHLPLQKVLRFVKDNKSDLNKLIKDKKYKEYAKVFGKTYYLNELRNFFNKYKIEKDINKALQYLNYFLSKDFFAEIKKLSFGGKDDPVEQTVRDNFFCIIFLLYEKDDELAEMFLSSLFTHYFFSFNKSSNIELNYKDIVTFIAKQKKWDIKESFGEKENRAYFVLMIANYKVEFEGRSIKTLRKKCYKKMMSLIVEQKEKR